MAYGIKTQLDMESVRKTRQEYEKHIKDMQELANKNVIKIKVDNVNSQLNETRKGFEGINNQTRSFVDNMEYAIKRVAQFAAGISIVYGAVKELKDGLQEIAEINRANVNIAMITGDSIENVKKGNKGLLDLAENLKVVNSEVMNGNEAWMRSGVSQEEANKNLATTTKLSKIAGEENKAMADSLIVIKNAYDLNSKSLEGYASKVALLDNKSATSSAKINSGMQYSAETFKSMGVDMDTALSWITNYSEKSAMSGEAIGRGFRSMLINFHKMQKGFKEGSEEETTAVNKLETLLNSKGIALRKNKDEWVDLSTVIKDIQKNIDKFSDVEKSQLAFRIGGKEQAEMTLSTLNNMKRIDELNGKLKQDSGAKALNESYEKYKQGLDAAKANLKNASTSFWMNVLDEKKIEGAVGGLTNLIKTLEMLATTEKSSGIALAGLSASFILLVKNANAVRNAFVRLGAMMELFSVIQRGVGTTAALSTAFNALASSVKASMLAFVTNPITLTIAALSALTFGVVSHIQHQRELKDQVDSLKSSYQDLTQAMKENNVEGMKNDSENLKKDQDKLQNLLKQKVDLEKEINDRGMVKADDPLKLKFTEITKQMEEQKKVLQEAGVQFDETTGKINKLAEAELQIKNNNNVEDIKKVVESEIEHKDRIIELATSYNSLNEQQGKDATQKANMTTIAEELKGKISGLIVEKDNEGNVTIKNLDLMNKEVGMLKVEGVNVDSLSKIKLTAAKDNAQAQINETTMTYKQMKERLAMYAVESQAIAQQRKQLNEYNNMAEGIGIQQPRKYNFNTGLWEGGNPLQGFFDSANKNFEDTHQKMIDSVAQLDKIYGSEDKVTKALDEGFTPALDKNTKATEKNKEAINEAKNSVKDFELALKSLDNTIYSLEANLSMMDDSSKEYREGIKMEIELLKEKNDMLNQGISMNEQYAGSLGNITGSSNTMIQGSTSGGAWKGKYSNWINDAAAKNGLDPILIASIIQQESSFNPNDVNSKSGATGLGQFLASTAREEGITDRKDPQQSIYGLAKYLRKRINWAGGDVWSGVRGYGEGTQEYENLIRGWYNKFSNGQLGDGGGNSGGNTSTQNVESEIDTLQSKQEDWEKQKIDVNKKIIELNNQLTESEIKNYDEMFEHVGKNQELAKENYDLFKDSDLSKASEYKAQVWKEINNKYWVLTQKENYIKQELQNSAHDKKFLAEMQKTLENVQLEKVKMVNELHQEFQNWQNELYNNSIKQNISNIDELQSKLDILDKSSKQHYGEKINLNNLLLEQEEEMKQKTLDRMQAVQELINKEKDPTTMQVWHNSMKQLKKDYDDISSKIIEIQQRNIELAKTQAYETIQKGIYDGKTQQEFEDGIGSQIEALNNQLEVMQKQNDALKEKQEREKNLLDIAEAQIKLQEVQNNKNVQQLKKDALGNWQFEYVANQQNVDSAESELRNRLKSNSDWEKQNTDKHKQDSLNDQKKALQDEISIRNEAYSRIKDNIEKAINENSQAIINGTISISSLINTSLGQVNTRYNGKYSGIISNLQGFINNYTSVLTDLNSKLANSLNMIENANNGNTTSSGIGNTVWVNGDTDSPDWQIAQKYYANLGYDIKQVDDNNYNKVSSSDILLGYAGTKYGSKTNATSITGADRYETELKAQKDALERRQQMIKTYGQSISQEKQSATNRDIVIIKSATDDETRSIRVCGSVNEEIIRRSWKDINSITYNELGQMVITVKEKVAEATAELSKLSQMQSSVINNGGATTSGGSSSSGGSSGGSGIWNTVKNIGSSIGKIFGFDTGGYTGDGEGLAVLHSKEIVLNKIDTKNILDAVSITRNMSSMLSNFKLPSIQLPDLNGIKNNNGSTIYSFNIDKLELPEVTNVNGAENLIEGLKGMALQYTTKRG